MHLTFRNVLAVIHANQNLLIHVNHSVRLLPHQQMSPQFQWLHAKKGAEEWLSERRSSERVFSKELDYNSTAGS